MNDLLHEFVCISYKKYGLINWKLNIDVDELYIFANMSLTYEQKKIYKRRSTKRNFTKVLITFSIY